ncbi:MAG TPA: type II CAAX endopeptidase family protein [Planctomycetota bacterium]
MNEAPGLVRVQLLLLGLAARRWMNRFTAAFRRPPKEGDPRTGTARKGAVGGVWSVLLIGVLLFQGGHLSYQLLGKFAARAEIRAGNVPATATFADPARAWATSGPQLTRALGAMLLLVALCQLVLAFGGANQDLGRVEWTLEWLFTFPASTGALFLAKTAEYALVNAYTWIMTLPLLGAFLFASGAGPWAIPLALAGTLAFSFMLAALRLLAETWLRTRFRIEKLKTLQAACTLVGTLLLMALFGAGATSALPASVLDALLDFPARALWIPWALPAALCDRPAFAVPLAASAVAVVGLSLTLARRLVRDGLLTSSGVYQGERGRRASSARVSGILGKDLRVLLRDRNFLVQTLAVPLVVLAFQLFLNPGMLKGIASDFRHAAAAAYSVGAYVLLCSAFHVLTVEGGTLWLLFTFPVPLDRILRRKALLWAAFAAVYTLGVLGVAAIYAPPRDWTAIFEAVLAVVGVVLYAFTVAALGALATDPLQTEVQRRFRPDMVYLAMLLAGIFAATIYSPSAWQRLVQTVLTTLLALALWQKVRDRIPYLLDPTEAPPPRVALSDGLIALLAFFVIQALLAAAFGTILPPALALLVAYSAGGAFVSAFSLFVFWRHKVPDLLRSTGLRPDRPGAFPRSLAWGVGAGLAATAVAAAYLAVLKRSEALRPFLEDATSVKTIGASWLAVLAIGAAPLVEEFLFRGLIFRGLRRSWGVTASVLACAGLFAAVHPPISFVPVFALGAAAAIAFERSGWLLAPLIAHALYNAAVFLVLSR